MPLGGMLTRMPFATGGSGSTYVYGYVDSNFKEDMTKEECLKFVSQGMSIQYLHYRLTCADKTIVHRKS